MGGKYLVTNEVAWHPVSHTNAAQCVQVAKCDLTNCVRGGSELKNRMLEQPVQTKFAQASSFS